MQVVVERWGQALRRIQKLGSIDLSTSKPLSRFWFVVVAALVVALAAVPVVAVAAGSRRAELVALATVAASGIALLLWHFERTRRSAEEQVLRHSEESLRAMIQHVAGITMVVDSDGAILYTTPSVERILGYKPGDIVGKNIADLLLPGDFLEARWLLAQTLREPGKIIASELRAQDASGHSVWLEATASNQLDDPAIGAILMTCRDITERKIREEQLQYQTLHDPLTGLANRALFVDRLEHALSGPTPLRGARSIAVFFLDLDDFKEVNDTLGHRAGDQLLVTVGERLRASVRPSDTVARLGGDEFTILVEHFQDLDNVINLAERILEEVSAPYDIEGQIARVTPSIGIAVSNSIYNRARDLLRNADVAMYEAKSHGKGRYVLFDTEMKSRVWETLEIETELRRAIEQKEFRVHYQPVVQLETGMVGEVEALVRWQHPERGIAYPAEFIPSAEQTGLILAIEQLVLEEACRQVHKWQTKYPSNPPLRLSVNISASQFREPDVVERVARTLRKTGLNPRHLELELPEDVVLDESQLTAAALQKLKQLGVRLTVDHSGSDYAALRSLNRCPVDALKIDRSVLAGLGRNPRDTARVNTAIQVARSLNLRATAEGIETAEQLTQLRELQCDWGQGYYFTEPLSAEALTQLFAAYEEDSKRAWIHPRDLYYLKVKGA